MNRLIGLILLAALSSWVLTRVVVNVSEPDYTECGGF